MKQVPAKAVLLLTEGSVSSVADTVFEHLNKPILTTIPLFVFMAQVMIRAKVIDDLYDMAHTIVGHIRGGLGVATVMSCSIFAAISGSSVATALSIGSSAVPQMKRFGYPERDALGVIAAGGTLGILIPPSGPMILYAIVSEVSIGALFLAGVIPGLLMALIFSVFCIMQAGWRDNVVAPAWAGWEKISRAMKRSFWAVMAPPVVMGLIFVMGMFLESIAIILITTPILLPAMVQLGIDPVWYGVLLMINLELAMITPPVGMNLFVIKGITDAPLGTVIRGAFPYVILMLAGLAMMIAFPGLATWLPYSAGFGR